MNQETQEVAPEPIRVSGEQMMVIFFYDLAVQQLSGMANQLNMAKLRSPAEQFLRTAEHLMKKRQGFLESAQNRIQPVNGVIGGA